MSLWDAVILGIVEGFTEYLPISSTGHLILTSKILKIAQSDFVKSFEITIQLGAILAVIALYWKKLLVDWRVIKRILVAFVPTGLVGLALYKIIKQYLIGSSGITLWALFAGGTLLIIFELLHREKPDATKAIEEITYQKSFWIGVFQSFAIIPGVSRSAATIIGGLWLNLKRETIVEFSFLLAMPTMLAATAFDLTKNFYNFNANQLDILAIGFITSFAVAIVGIKFLLRFIKNRSFIYFGIYRILAALLFWLIIF